MTFDEWWDTTKATATPETFEGWEQSCRQAWNAATAQAEKAAKADFDRVHAQLEVAQAASYSAVSKAQWQAVTNKELNEAADELQRLRIAVARAVPAMHSYAGKNPKHHMNGVLQDPCGVHAWLVDFGA